MSASPDVTLFLCGDVMTGRAVDQILPCPSDPVLHEPFVRSALEYLEIAERVNGPIARPADLDSIWGDAIAELDRMAPAVRMINLETSITTSGDYERKGINYRMHPANTPCLTAAKIDCCALANNHVLDWGKAGLADTLRVLRGAGIKTAGAGCDLRDAWTPAVIEIGGGSRVLFFAVGTADSGIEPNWAAAESAPGIAFLEDLSDKAVGLVAEHVEQRKVPGDIAVLSIHWGENWGYRIPRRQREFAHKVIDAAGIDVVHGHSSHHPKGIEVHNEKPILYGCGDFLNDYEGISGYKEFRPHLALAYFLTLNSVTAELLHLEMTPLEIKRMRLQHAAREDALWLRDTLTLEGAPLGTEAVLDDRNHLILSWRRSA